jgi:hypothetical protein
MKIHKTKLILITTFFLLFYCAPLQVPAHAGSQEGCLITIRNDIHLAPAAELATTKGYPDIVKLENSLIQVTSIPNRGRLIFDYVYKPTGQSQFYTNTAPMPIKTSEGYFLEFGGFYASYPWNPRSNQPYDLAYEVFKETAQESSIKIYKKGMESGIDFESFITILKNDAHVYVTIKLTNASDKEKTIDFSDHSVISLGEAMKDEVQIILPKGIKEVAIGKSADAWMGSAGETVSWPQPWQKWGGFKGEGRFRADLQGVLEHLAKLIDPGSKASFVKEWSTGVPYQSIAFSSWGPGYEDVFGAYPGILVTNRIPGLVIPAGKSRTFEIKFYASKG